MMKLNGVGVLCAILRCSLCIPLSQFYPFGDTAPEIADDQVPKGDATVSPAITLQGAYTFYSQQHSTVHVNTDGAISFGTSIGPYSSDPTPFGGAIPLVAPFWANIDTTPNQGGRIWYRETNSSSLLSRANADVNNFFSITSFTATHLFIVTWDRVGYYNQQFDLVNTFQCVLVTNDVQTFAVFLYANRQLQWIRHDRNVASYAQVGFNAGDNTTFMTLNESRTAAIGDIAIISNVVVKRGYWIYQISGSDIVEGKFPAPSVTVTAPNNQSVGQPLTLKCKLTTVRGITSRVDVVWSNNGTVLERVIGVNISSITSNTTTYIDTYTIQLLTVADDGKVYSCKILINAHPTITMNSSIILDVVVPPPNITTSPSGTVKGAMVGGSLLVQCIVDTVDGVEPSLVNISWMGPGGDLIVNASSVTVSQITSINNTYNRSLHFTSLVKENKGQYTCFVMIFGTSVSRSFKIQALVDLTVARSFTSVKILEGQSVNISCSPSIMEVGLTWLRNGVNIVAEEITFSPPVLNHNLRIENALPTHSGVYTCSATVGELTAEKNITVTVLPACDNDFSGALFWPNSKQDSLVTQSCSKLHPSFRSGVRIGRQCRSDGSWSPVDLRNCTMFIGSKPVVIVYFTITVNNTDMMTSADITDDVWSYLQSNINTSISNRTSRMWEYSNSGSPLISFTLTFNLETISSLNDTTDDIQDNFDVNENYILPVDVNLTDEGFQVLVFQPKSSCTCRVNTSSESRMFKVCMGPSVAPCLCDSSSCMCNGPTFVGDRRGRVCGLDSDSDGFPDVGLDCDEPSCEMDVCPKIHSVVDGLQRSRFCNATTDIGFVGCRYEQDKNWTITWPATEVDIEARQKCPGGSEAVGLARRKCGGNNTWEKPNVSECQTIEQLSLRMRAEELSDIVNNTFTAEDRDMTVMFMPEEAVDIMVELNEITNTTKPLLPNDVSSSAEILDILQSLTKTAGNEIGQSMAMQITENMVDTLDSMFDGRNDVSFDQMANQENATATGALLQKDAENVGILFSTTFNISGNESVQGTMIRKNLVIEVQIPTEELLNTRNVITFPSVSTIFDNDAFFTKMIPMIEIPSTVVLEQYRNECNKSEGKRIPIINGVARNMHLATGPGTNIESPILSSQISLEKTNFSDERVSLSFNIGKAANRTRFNIRCAFFDFENGNFSKDGISQISNNDDGIVQCTSSHLTSFAVLVDTSGSNSAQSEALSVVSYVGCGISIACLTFTVIVIIVLRKQVFNTAPDFIHFNLAIALLLGLIIFVSGIETAADYRTSCLIVAILLHYFFMAAFSWMLCEGILLFVWLNFVLYEGVFKTRKFFILIGWGLPLPIIIISSAISHEQYGTDDWCWISEEKGAIWAFIAPMLLIIINNGIVLIITLCQIFRSKKSSLKVNKATQSETLKSLAKAAILLLPLLGLTWVFGLLAVNEDTIVFAWIFTILNSLQGALIMLFHVVRNEQFLKFVRQRGRRGTTSATSKTRSLSASNETNTAQKSKKTTTSTPSEFETIEEQIEVISPSLYDDKPKFNEYVLSPNQLNPVISEAQIVTPTNNSSFTFEIPHPENGPQQLLEDSSV